MRRYLRLLLILIISGLLHAPIAARAQGQGVKLSLLKPVTGQITAQQPEQLWTFDAVAGQHLSVRMQATTGNLAPVLELRDASGGVLMSSTPTIYHAAILDDFVAPGNVTYTLRATRESVTETVGNYNLSLLPGFGFLLLNDTLDEHSPMRLWQTTNAFSAIANNKLRLELRADNLYTWTTADKLGLVADCYLQADVQVEQANHYWEQGLILRLVKRDNQTKFYIFLVNSKNQWKFGLSQASGLTVLQDWSEMPSQIQKAGTLAALVKGNAFTFFYNNQRLGSLTDNALSEAGEVGVVTGTGPAPDTVVSNLYSNIIVTLPANQAHRPSATVPDKLTAWQRDAATIIGELRSAELIPGEGKEVLRLSQSFVSNNTSGSIVFIPLAKGISLTDLVYTADVQWESTSEDVACALEFRVTDANNFTIVYFDRKGGYGVRQTSEKPGVIVSEYNLTDAINKTNDANNRITAIAVGNGLVIYINGVLVANLNVQQATGGLYIAAYNYGKSSTYCRFNNLWVRSLD